MTERDVREALAEVLRGHRLDALSQDGGHHCACRSDSRFEQRGGDHPWPTFEHHLADMALASDVVAQMLAEAEQRGREDNADHGMCYVHGSKALDARLAEARAEALREAADAWQWGEWAVLTEPIKAGEQVQRILGAAQAVTDWLRSRAALTTEADQ